MRLPFKMEGPQAPTTTQQINATHATVAAALSVLHEVYNDLAEASIEQDGIARELDEAGISLRRQSDELLAASAETAEYACKVLALIRELQ